MTYRVVSIVRSKTKHGGAMWTCTCLTGEKVVAFPPNDRSRGTLHLFQTAGYGTLLTGMEEGARLHFNRHPIQVEMVKKGEYWELTAVAPKPEDAQPDHPFHPQAFLYRDRLMDWAQVLLEQDFIVWDCETTGTQIGFDEIIQIGWVEHIAWDVVTSDSTGSVYIYPSDITLLHQENGAAQTHNITETMLMDAGDFPSHIDTLSREILHARIWVGYNIIGFDAPLLERQCAAYGQEPPIPLAVIDVMDSIARYVGEWDNTRERWRVWKLVEAAEIMGIPTENAHDALADCRMTLALIERMALGIEPDQCVMARLSDTEGVS